MPGRYLRLACAEEATMLTDEGKGRLVDLAMEMVELDRLAKEVSAAKYQNEVATAGLKERVEDWVDKVKEVADRFGPASYTISLNVPWGVSVSFTWES
jgi:hypothetical protein